MAVVVKVAFHCWKFVIILKEDNFPKVMTFMVWVDAKITLETSTQAFLFIQVPNAWECCHLKSL